MISREVDPSDNGTKIPKKSSSSTNPTSWTRFKDPRIVRVPRAFGGKDRHSKVFTVKGLRDRRVRLSVPTALQLYDLQDKLGLNQPSKVFDWLINEVKHEIDEPPPLQMPPIGEATKTVVVSDEGALKLAALNFDLNLLKGNSNSFNFGLHQNNFFPRSPSNSSQSVSLAHSGSDHGVAVPQLEEIQNFNVMAALPSTMYMPLTSQVLVYPPGLPQYFFHQHNIASLPEFDPKDINFQTLMSSCSENPSSSTSLRPIDDSTMWGPSLNK